MSIQFTQNTSLLPLQANTNNSAYKVSGWYNSVDPNIAATNAELLTFSTYVPSGQILPVASRRGAILADLTTLTTYCESEWAGGGGAESGITPFVQPVTRSVVIVESYSLSGSLNPTNGIGLLVHEWGHAVDNHYGNYVYGGLLAGGPGRSSQSDVQALWNRVVSANWFGNGQGHYYAWTNVKEFWAEAYRFHWMGAAGAGWTTADQKFRGQVSGSSAEPGPDDSFATTLHGIIAALAPPFPS